MTTARARLAKPVKRAVTEWGDGYLSFESPIICGVRDRHGEQRCQEPIADLVAVRHQDAWAELNVQFTTACRVKGARWIVLKDALDRGRRYSAETPRPQGTAQARRGGAGTPGSILNYLDDRGPVTIANSLPLEGPCTRCRGSQVIGEELLQELLDGHRSAMA